MTLSAWALISSPYHGQHIIRFLFLFYFFLTRARCRAQLVQRTGKFLWRCTPHDAFLCHFRQSPLEKEKIQISPYSLPPGCSCLSFLRVSLISSHSIHTHVLTLGPVLLFRTCIDWSYFHPTFHNGADILWHVRQAPGADGLDHCDYGFLALRL